MPTHITILDDPDPRDIYTVGASPSSGPFPITFNFFDAVNDITVIKTVAGVDTKLVYGNDFTVVGDTTYDGGFHGGSMSLNVAVTNCTITQYYNPLFQRTDDFPNVGKFNMQTFNTTLDRFVTLLQALRASLSRTPSLPVTTSLLNILFPLPVASKAIGWNASANGLTNLDLAALGALALPLPVAQGGTAAIDAPAATRNLGLAGAQILQIQNFA